MFLGLGWADVVNDGREGQALRFAQFRAGGLALTKRALGRRWRVRRLFDSLRVDFACCRM